MSVYTITVKVGPHVDAEAFADYLVGEIGYRIDNEKDLVGVPVSFGLSCDDSPGLIDVPHDMAVANDWHNAPRTD